MNGSSMCMLHTPCLIHFLKRMTTLNFVLQCIRLFSYCLPPSKLFMSYVGVCHFFMFSSSPWNASCPYALQIFIEWVEFVLIELAPLQVRKPTAGKIACLLHSHLFEQHAAGSWLEFRTVWLGVCAHTAPHPCSQGGIRSGCQSMGGVWEAQFPLLSSSSPLLDLAVRKTISHLGSRFGMPTCLELGPLALFSLACQQPASSCFLYCSMRFARLGWASTIAVLFSVLP